jgi:hypothetical protein
MHCHAGYDFSQPTPESEARPTDFADESGPAVTSAWDPSSSRKRRMWIHILTVLIGQLPAVLAGHHVVISHVEIQTSSSVSQIFASPDMLQNRAWTVRAC